MFASVCVCAPQTGHRLGKALAAAEKEYKSAKTVLDPLDKVWADVKGRLEEAMGSSKLGSMLEMEDIDVITRKEKELVRATVCVCILCSVRVG